MKKLLLLSSILYLFFFSGCSKNDNNPVEPPTIPAPLASFNYGGNLETMSEITFTNTSQNADKYLWEFGDGTASTDINPKKIYTKYGNYTVKLTAINTNTGKSSQTSQSISIKPSKVFIKDIIIEEIPFVDQSGAGWDLTTGPDVFFIMVDSTSMRIVLDASNLIYYDVTPSMLPLEWTSSQGIEIPKYLWNNTFLFFVFDWDDASNNDLIGITNGFKISQVISSNPPAEIILRSSDNRTRVKLTLKWE